MLWRNKPIATRWWKMQRTHALHGLTIKRYFVLGFSLLVAFIIQESYQWNWSWLTALQTDNVYQQLSGFALLIYLAHQWHCAVLRTRGLMHEAAYVLNRHKLFGAIAPLVFYAHAQHLGFAYLQVLSLTYFAIFLTGLFNYEVSHIHRQWFRPVWITVHIGLSTGLLFLLAYHIFISYSYE